MLDMSNSLAKACTFFRPQVKCIRIVLVGCGGTGSWLAQSLARITYGERRMQISLSFVDDDYVEEKNVIRQNFSPAEIGRNKAKTLATRFSAAYGLAIEAVAEKFHLDMVAPPYVGRGRGVYTILCGAVDNATGRKALCKAVARWPESTIWIDAGNRDYSGQVVIGNAVTLTDLQGAFPFRNKCTKLPVVFQLLPNLMESQPEEKADHDLSCEALALANYQHMFVNNWTANIAAGYVTDLLANTLKCFKTSFDMRSKMTFTKFITPEVVAREIQVVEGGDAITPDVFALSLASNYPVLKPNNSIAHL